MSGFQWFQVSEHEDIPEGRPLTGLSLDGPMYLRDNDFARSGMGEPLQAREVPKERWNLPWVRGGGLGG